MVARSIDGKRLQSIGIYFGGLKGEVGMPHHSTLGIYLSAFCLSTQLILLRSSGFSGFSCKIMFYILKTIDPFCLFPTRRPTRRGNLGQSKLSADQTLKPSIIDPARAECKK